MVIGVTSDLVSDTDITALLKYDGSIYTGIVLDVVIAIVVVVVVVVVVVIVVDAAVVVVVNLCRKYEGGISWVIVVKAAVAPSCDCTGTVAVVAIELDLLSSCAFCAATIFADFLEGPRPSYFWPS